MASLINVGRELAALKETEQDRRSANSARSSDFRRFRGEQQMATRGNRSKAELQTALAGNNLLLFSNPNSLDGRNHITIKASLDGGMTWPREHQLLLDEQNGRGYSCMTMIDDETVGVLGVIGPTRMAYERVIPIVDITAKLVGAALNSGQ